MLRCLVPFYVNRGQAKPPVIFTIPSGILINILYNKISSVKCQMLDNTGQCK